MPGILATRNMPPMPLRGRRHPQQSALLELLELLVLLMLPAAGRRNMQPTLLHMGRLRPLRALGLDQGQGLLRAARRALAPLLRWTS